jgi:hypothetical protein
VTETSESATTWAEREFLTDEWRDAVRRADILLVPTEGILDQPDLRFFPAATSELFAFLRDHAGNDVAIEICTTDDDFKEVTRQADILYIAGFVVTSIAAPLFVNLVTEYVKKRMEKREKSTTIITSVTVHDAKTGRSVGVHYEGPTSEFSTAILDAARQAQLPSVDVTLSLPDERTQPRSNRTAPQKLSPSRRRRLRRR